VDMDRVLVVDGACYRRLKDFVFGGIRHSMRYSESGGWAVVQDDRWKVMVSLKGGEEAVVRDESGVLLRVAGGSVEVCREPAPAGFGAIVASGEEKLPLILAYERLRELRSLVEWLKRVTEEWREGWD